MCLLRERRTISYARRRPVSVDMYVATHGEGGKARVFMKIFGRPGARLKINAIYRRAR